MDNTNTVTYPDKPLVDVSANMDGNVFAIIGNVRKALVRAGFKTEAEQYQNAAFNAGSYDEVLQLSMRYANFT